MRACALLLLAAILPGACTSPRRAGPDDWPRTVVVLCPPERQADADAIARTFAAAGDYRTAVTVTPIRRGRSSASVYGLRRNPDRVTEVGEVLKTLGEEIEILPFQQEAGGGNTVVLWLATKAP